MDATPIIVAIGLGAALAVVLLAIRRGLARGDNGTRAAPPSANPRPADTPAGPIFLRPSRIVVVGDVRASTGGRRTEPSGRTGPTIDSRRRILGSASAVLVVATLALLVVANLPASSQPSGAVFSATATPGSLAAPDASPAERPGASPTNATQAPAAAPAPAPSSSAVSPGASVPGVARTASPRPLATLEPCPGRPNCYLYIVQFGDSLTELADFFGIPVDVILRLNPQITDPSLIVVGDRLVLPTPTR